MEDNQAYVPDTRTRAGLDLSLQHQSAHQILSGILDPGTRDLPPLKRGHENGIPSLFNEWGYLMRRNLTFEVDEMEFSHSPSSTEKLTKPLVFKQRFMNGETHRYNQVMKCATCGMEFKNVNTLKDHLVKHSGERPFKCRRCKMAFGQRRTRNKHERNEICADPKRKTGPLFTVLKGQKHQ